MDYISKNTFVLIKEQRVLLNNLNLFCWLIYNYYLRSYKQYLYT